MRLLSVFPTKVQGEEKLMAEEGLKRTKNDLIHIGCPIPFDIEEFLEQLDELMEALNDIGVLGMTVSQVFGCGLQKGHEEVYRGKKYDVNLVPKIKLETVVCEIPVDTVLDAAEKALRTGNYGDGKIFVTELTDAVRIRTGQRGPEAIMDIPGEKK